MLQSANSPSQLTGIATSLILDLGGHVREAGGTIFNDATYFVFGNSRYIHPLLNRRRSVDFASSSTFLMRKKAITEIEGYDPEILDVIYQDIDLGLRLKQRGWKIIFQPFSVFIDVTNNNLSAVVPNRNMAFISKWSHVLEMLPSPKSVGLSSSFVQRARILWVDAIVPETTKDSGKLYCFGLFQFVFSPYIDRAL